ncbi:glycosyltransferase [Microbacterium sp. NC79]|uniref:glycosyltransferase n=1 Tax=Microbacterium sp. NC79 TaxID=2851009 RepID=UPI001C2C2F53|nr:glycosyltransferase [Microbacterium sp. NC79]MBV0894075.1 glycosyltransferase [Microbacterium sp. NC79]
MKPAVSIIVPLFNDEEWVAAALDSCLKQTSGDFEVLCIDDASTDTTAAIVEEYASRDSRIRLIQQPTNASAFQARRAGIGAAAGDYVLFLDGDDALAPNAVKATVAKARSAKADVVGFGVEIVTANSKTPRRFEAALQPRHKELHSTDIVTSLFPVGEEANGHLWRYLFATDLLRAAYEGFTRDATYYRANDLPITLLALAHATKYVSLPDRLYRYNFQRGTSGHTINGVDHFNFLLSGIDPITAIADEVSAISGRFTHPEALLRTYESARLHIIGNVLKYCIRDTTGDLQSTCLRLLKDKVGDLQVTRAAAAFVPSALDSLSAHATRPVQPTEPVRNVLLYTAYLGIGGLQSVLQHHAQALVNTGHRVTIAVAGRVENEVELPFGVDIVVVAGHRLERLDRWVEICQQYEIDVIIDHHLLYNDNWPWFALTALDSGVPTIGWVHNFALRPLFDGNQRITFLTTHLNILLKVATLSPTDVAFWKLQGVEHVYYIPNPPSQLSLLALDRGGARTAPDQPIEIAWWGRLDHATKQVMHLIETAAHLKRLGLDFRMTLIGPETKTLSAKDVHKGAAKRGVSDFIELKPGLPPEDLLDVLSHTHLMISASAIEGYQLTIIEAQLLGIPVVMYDLPWLTTVRDNPGIVTTPPGEPHNLAEAVVSLVRDADRYERLSREGVGFAEKLSSLDIEEILSQLINDELSPRCSPEPTLRDARILTQWLVRYGELNVGDSERNHRKESAASIRRERDRAIGELKSIKSGPSFRIGRAVTSVPRKLRGLLHRTKRLPEPGVAQSFSEPSAPRPEKSHTPDVSFVVPVFNAAPWLEVCVTSALAQTRVNLEVICIDDGSTDESRQILNNLAQQDSRVTVLCQENSGQSVARNLGLQAATGRYIIYLDSDDYWAKDALHDFVRHADENALDMYLFDAVPFKDGDIEDSTWNRYSTYYQRKKSYSDTRSGAQLMSDMRRNNDYRPHVGMYMTRTAFARQAGPRFIPSIVHQDNPYTFALLLNARRAAHTSQSVYARRMRPGSTITTLTPARSARGYFLSYLAMSRELRKHSIEAPVEEQVLDIVSRVYEGARKQFELLSDAEADEIHGLDPSGDAVRVHAMLLAADPAPDDPAHLSAG